MTHRNSHFKQGQGVFTCHNCGKRTRDTGNGERGLDICRACIDEAEAENSHSDSHDAPVPGCKWCEDEVQ